jgi:hypothetical protein
VPELLYVNGIDGDTGEYLVPPLDLEQAAALAHANADDAATARRLSGARAAKKPQLGLPFRADPTNVAQAGWAIVFHRDEPVAVREALAALIEHRRTQAGEERTKVLEYRAGEDRRAWLTRNGAASGSIQPTVVPYYILLVGEPNRIPFEFQCLLDGEYAVGRVCFDTPSRSRPRPPAAGPSSSARAIRGTARRSSARTTS